MFSADEALDVYLGARCLGLWRAARCLAWSAGADAAAELDAALVSAGGPRRALRRNALRVWLSGAVAMPFVLRRIAGLRGAAEVRAAAAARAAETTGWPPGSAEVWLEGNPAERDVLGVAAPTALVRDVCDAGRRAGVRVVSVKPWWAAAMASRRELVERVDLLAVADVEALVILVAQAGAWTEALALSPPPTPEQAEAAIQRRATGLADGRMHVARLRMSPEDATGQPVSWTAESVRSFAMP